METGDISYFTQMYKMCQNIISLAINSTYLSKHQNEKLLTPTKA